MDLTPPFAQPNNLPKITESNGRKVVSARELYESLGHDLSQWARWYKKNIIDNAFAVENEDYVSLDIMSNEKSRGKFAQDFALSLDFAKRLAMMARTEQGEKIRKYFIQCEEELKAVKPLSRIQMLLQCVQTLADHEDRLDNHDIKLNYHAERMGSIEEKVLNIEVKTKTRPEYFTILAYATYTGYRVAHALAKQLGSEAAKLCKRKGLPVEKVPDTRFGYVGSYPEEILKEVFQKAA